MRSRGGRLRAQAVSLLTAGALVALGAACGGGDDGPKIDRWIPVGQDPTDVVTAYGAVWTVNGGGLARVDPEKNALALKQLILTGEAPDAVAAGGNRIWVAHTLGRSVTGVDPRTNKAVESVKVASRATDVAYGEGSVWASLGPGHKVQRVDIERRRAIVPTIDTGLGPAGLAVGEGAVWVANQFDYTVSRIDPATNKVAATIKVGVQPTDVAIGEGAVWVSQTDSRTLARIDPEENKQTDEIPLSDDSPLDVATGFGSIWMPIAESDLLMRVNP